MAEQKSKRSVQSLPLLSWLTPTIACVVFAVLIAGAVGVRQVIILVRKPQEPQTEEVVRVPKSEKPPVTTTSTVAPTKGEEPPDIVAEIAHESAGSELEVLPPPAAKKPGRKLPRMLLVGEGEYMFRKLEDAIHHAICGDTIEIRTNGPLLVHDGHFKPEMVEDQPLTIRAGSGFAPVLRKSAKWPPMIQVTDGKLKLIGLHFTSIVPGTSFVVATGTEIYVEGCSFTGIPSPQNRWSGNAISNAGKTSIERCIFRNASGVHSYDDGIGHISLSESAFICGSATGGKNQRSPGSIDIFHSTLINNGAFVVIAEETLPQAPVSFRMHRCLYTSTYAGRSNLVRLEPGFNIPPPTDVASAREALRRVFFPIDVRNNIARLENGCGSLAFHTQTQPPHDASHFLKPPLFAALPTADDSLRFGDKVEQARLLFRNRQEKEARTLAAAVLPQDFVPRSTGPLASQMRNGIRYGCDVTKLPVPPPSTL